MLRVLVVLPDYNEMNFVHAVLRKIGFDVESLNSTRKFDETTLSMNPEVVITKPDVKHRGALKLYEAINKRSGKPRIVLLDPHYHGTEDLPPNVDEVCRAPVNVWELVPAICRGSRVDADSLEDKIGKFFKDVKKPEKNHVHVKGQIPVEKDERIVHKGTPTEGDSRMVFQGEGKDNSSQVFKSEGGGRAGADAQVFEGEKHDSSQQTFKGGSSQSSSTQVFDGESSLGPSSQMFEGEAGSGGVKSEVGATDGRAKDNAQVFEGEASAGGAPVIQDKLDAKDTRESSVSIQERAEKMSSGVHQFGGDGEESSSSTIAGEGQGPAYAPETIEEGFTSDERSQRYSDHLNKLKDKPKGNGGFVTDKAKLFKKKTADMVSDSERETINTNKKDFVNALFHEDD